MLQFFLFVTFRYEEKLGKLNTKQVILVLNNSMFIEVIF